MNLHNCYIELITIGKHDSTCLNKDETYLCRCEKGWTGEYCAYG